MRPTAARPSRESGFSLIETVLAVALLAVIGMAMITGYGKVNELLTQQQLKQKALGFAEGEVQRITAYARWPKRDPSDGSLLTDASGQYIPFGYNEYLVPATFNNGSPVTVNYSVQPNPNAPPRTYSFLRKVTIATLDAGGPEERKEISVTLSDPENRFSPLSLSTIIKKPNPAALDFREAVDMGSLSGTMVDETLAAIPLDKHPKATLIPSAGPQQSVLVDSLGRFQFDSLSTRLTYTVKLEADQYWPETLGPISLSAGLNAIPEPNPRPIQPFYFGDVEVAAKDADTGEPLANVLVYLYHNGYFPNPDPTMSQTWPYAYTGASGEALGKARFRLPLPAKGSVNYPATANTAPYYMLYYAKLDPAYILKMLYPTTIVPLTRDGTASYTALLKPYYYATLTVSVQAEGGGPLNHARVELYNESSETTLLSGTNGYGFGYTNAAGQVQLNVPINDAENPDRESRTIYLRARLPGYRAHDAPPALTLGKGQTASRTIALSPSVMTLTLFPAPDPENNKIHLTNGSNASLTATAELRDSAWGAWNMAALGSWGYAYDNRGYWYWTLVSRRWDWSFSNPGVGYATPATSATNPTTVFQTIGNGAGTLTYSGAATLRIDWYDWNTGWVNDYYVGYTLDFAQSATADIVVASAGEGEGESTPTFQVDIGGTAYLQPEQSQAFTASASYGGSAAPADTTYAWSLSNGLGSLSANTGSAVTFSAGSTPGTVELTVTAHSDTLNMTASRTITVSLAYTALSLSLSPTSPSTVALPNNLHISASVAGAAGAATVTWLLYPTLDCSGGPSSSSVGSLASGTGTSNTFTSSQPGSVSVQATATDSVARSVSACLQVNVTPPGGTTL